MQGESTKKQKRSTRNRKRSKRRAIFCPVHSSYLESRSPKYKLSSCQEGHDAGRMDSVDDGEMPPFLYEWIEAFWCPECQVEGWYYVKENPPRCYAVKQVSAELCQQLVKSVLSCG